MWRCSTKSPKDTDVRMIDIEKLRTLYKFSKELSLQDAQDLLKTAKSTSFKKRNNF